MIQIVTDRTTLEVGEQISGQAIWTPDRPVSPREIRVFAGWRTEGRGDRSNGKAGELRYPPGPNGFPPPVQLEFAFTIPPTGPVSYDGKLIRILWEIVVQIDLPMASDELMQLPFLVLPKQL